MDTDECSPTVTATESIEKDLKRNQKKFAKSLSKQKRTRKKNSNSCQITMSQEAMSPLEEKKELERQAVDYLKELSDTEDGSTSNFQEGLRNFCKSQFLEDEIGRTWEMRSRLFHKNSGSPSPVIKDVQETVVNSDDQSHIMAPKLREGIDPYRDRKPVKVSSPSPPRVRRRENEGNYRSKEVFGKTLNMSSTVNQADWMGRKDLDLLVKMKMMERKDIRESNIEKVQEGGEEGVSTLQHRKFMQRANQKLSKGNGRFSSQGRRFHTTVSGSFRVTEGLIKAGDVKETNDMMTEVVLQGKGLGMSKLEKAPRVLSNLLRPRSQIDKARTMQGFGDMEALLGEYNTREEELKARKEALILEKEKQASHKVGETLHNIVNTVLVAKGNTIMRSRASCDGIQSGRDKDQATVKFWNDVKEMSERCRSNSRSRPGTANAKDDEKNKTGEVAKREVMQAALQTSPIFPSAWPKRNMKKFAAGVQGKSVVIINVPRSNQRKNTHSSEDLDEITPTQATRRTTSREQTLVKSHTQSLDISITKTESLSKSSYPPSQPASLLIKPKAHNSRANERVTNVGNLRARLISHEDVLTSLGFSQGCLITDNPRFATQETAKSHKKREYVRRSSIKKDDYSIPVGKEQSQSTLITSQKGKPQMMTLYSWDTLLRRESM